MRWNRLKLASLGIGLALAGCTAAHSDRPAGATAAPAPVAEARPAWAHSASDIPADEAVRFGQLPNGMRYALMRNATPPGAAAIRLRFDSGSLQERDDQRGLAHFIEHLTLNETRNVPEGELVRILERAGLSFGPDTNAQTHFEQTFYMLDLPRADEQTVDTALFLMREVAGEATLNPAVIERERGIILSEERTRASAMLRLFEDELGYMFPNDPLGRRMPIGSTEVIRTAQRPQFADYYDGYYRPERATLIAVGDFDVAALEAKVRERFGDWRARGEAAADLPPFQPSERQVETRVFVEPGVPNRVSLTWVKPRDERPDARATRSEEILRQLGFAILNRRMERLASGANPPFLVGVAAQTRLADRAEITQIITAAQPGAWRGALQTVEQEHRRALQHGFTQAELDREISEMRARLTAAATGAATRTSPNLAQALIGAVNEDRVFSSPATDLELFNAAVTNLRSEQVTAAFRAHFPEGGPLLHLASPEPIENGEALLRTAFNESRQVAVAAPAAQQAMAWPYTDFGAAGTVAERRELPQIGATAVRFANGVRLTVKPTQFRDDEIMVTARIGGGQLTLPADRATGAWAIPLGGFVGGGLGQLSFEDLQTVLAGKVFSADAAVADDAYTLTGKTRPEDLATQLQLLAAYVRDPGFRDSMWDRLRGISGTIHDQLESTPSGVFQRDSASLLRSGDRRWATPSREEMAAMPVAALADVLRPALANAPIEVIVVGDITVEEAVRQVAATFGALPARGPVAAATGAVRFPDPGAVTRTHRGRPDQALGFIAWPTTDFYADQRRTRGLNLLSRVFQLRLLDQIREAQGTAYSPIAAHSGSDRVPGYGYFAAFIEAPPQAMDGFFRDAQAIARALREQPIPADELDRARRPLVEGMQRSRNSSNEWWIGNLAGVQDDPARIESITGGVGLTGEITAAELQQLARQYLVDGRAWRLTVLPEAAPAQ